MGKNSKSNNTFSALGEEKNAGGEDWETVGNAPSTGKNKKNTPEQSKAAGQKQKQQQKQPEKKRGKEQWEIQAEKTEQEKTAMPKIINNPKTSKDVKVDKKISKNQQVQQEEQYQNNKQQQQKSSKNSSESPNKKEKISPEKKKKTDYVKKSTSNNNTSGKKSAFWDHICITSFLFLALFFMGYMKYIEQTYNKTTKVSIAGFNNLYEVLDLDSGASAADIKRAYRKMAVLWHPDKNANCVECEEKFQQILKAYEVLGNAEKKGQYDSTNGVTEQIQSRAIQLNSRNFENFVLESNDIWILQVYENSDSWCHHMAPFWESSVEKFSSIVKFGRINRETDPELLAHIPFSVQVMPTIFSYNTGQESKIYTYDRSNPELAMHKFVGEAIINKVNVFSGDQSESLYNSLQQYHPNSNKVDIVYLSTGSKMPIELKYAAFKYNDVINFHVSKYGDLIKSQASFGNTQDNFLIFFNDENLQKREVISFKMEKKFKNTMFRNYLKLAKFLIVPEIDRSSFKDYCENITLRSHGDDDNVDENKQNLCIVINTEEPKAIKEIQKIKNQLLDNITKEFKNGSGKIDRVFENFGQIQFITIPLNFHWQFKKSLTSEELKFPFEQALAYAILAENRKISFEKSVFGLEDWILDLVDNDSNYEYLNEYLNEENRGIELAHLLKFKADTIFNNIIKSVLIYAKDWKVLLTVLVAYATLSYVNRDIHESHDKSFIWKITLVVYASIIVIFTYGDIHREIWQ